MSNGDFSALRRPPVETLFTKTFEVQGQTFTFKFRKMEVLDWQNAIGRGARLGEIYGWEPDPENGGQLAPPSRVIFDSNNDPIQVVAATCETIGVLMGAEIPNGARKTSFDEWLTLASIPEANEYLREMFMELRKYRPSPKEEEKAKKEPG